MIYQFILIPVIFIIIKYISYKWTNGGCIPKWLDYAPYSCELCLTFWLLMFAYISVGLSFEIYITLIGGVILAILNAIAMYINQKNKTISIEEYDEL